MLTWITLTVTTTGFADGMALGFGVDSETGGTGAPVLKGLGFFVGSRKM